MTLYDLMAITVADCPHCHAKSGTKCANNSGKQSGSVHWQRKQAVQMWRKQGNEQLYKLWRRDCIETIKRINEPEYGTSCC